MTRRPTSPARARSVVTVGSAQRFAERARARRRPDWGLLGRVAAAALVLAVAAWMVLGSSVLAVRTITVTGTERLPVEAVRELAVASHGRPLARVDVRAIEDDVRRLPPVRSVDVRRAWPSTLRVEVTERVPVAALPAAGGGFDLVDGEGVVLGTEPKAPSEVPVLQVDVAKAGAGTVREAEQVLRALPADLRERVTKVAASSRDSVTLTLDGGATVLWGSADDSARKVEVLTVLLSTKAKVYDVSAPDIPVTR